MFIGRENELTRLRTLGCDESPALAVVYGRRRVGKTALIREACKGRKTLFFEGLEGQPQSKQISNFLFQLQSQVNFIEVDHGVKTWSAAFLQLVKALRKEPFLVVFDEFQWMAAYRTGLVSELKMMWDQYFSQFRGSSMVLCGSIASFMVSKVLHSKALYGRVSLEIHLKPFSVSESQRMLKAFGEAEVVESMLLLGGIPLYLKMMRNVSSLYLGVNDQAFTETGYFYSEFDKIFVSHFGRKDAFSKIVKALAQHPYGLYRDEIASVCEIALSGKLSADLFDLEAAGFIKSFVPIDKKEKSKIQKYVLSDPYLSFYLSFIEPHKRAIALGKKDVFLKLSQGPKFASFLGRQFELFCMNHAYQISEMLGFSGVDYSAGPYFRRALNEEGIQIDLMFDRSDNVITLCEMKYSRAPVGVEVVAEVERKVRVLEKLSRKTIQRVLFVRDGVTQELLRSGYFYRIFTCHDFFKKGRC